MKKIGLVISIIMILLVLGGGFAYYQFVVNLHGENLLVRAQNYVDNGNIEKATNDYLKYTEEIDKNPTVEGFEKAIVFFINQGEYAYAEQVVETAGTIESFNLSIQPVRFDDTPESVYIGQSAELKIKFPANAPYAVILSAEDDTVSIYENRVTGVKAGKATITGKTPTGFEFSREFEVADFGAEVIRLINQERAKIGVDALKIDDRINETTEWHLGALLDVTAKQTAGDYSGDYSFLNTSEQIKKAESFGFKSNNINIWGFIDVAPTPQLIVDDIMVDDIYKNTYLSNTFTFAGSYVQFEGNGVSISIAVAY